jgi:hypothetical protein
MRAPIVGIVVLVLSASSAAEAQVVPALEEGTRVWVTTADGREQEGSVASMSLTDLVMRVNDASVSIALGSVRRIEGRDPLGNGIRNGGIAGAVALGGFGLYVSQVLCEVPDGCLKNDLGPIAILTGLGAGAGMAAGALIDYAIKGRRLLYSYSGAANTIEVLPRLTVHSVGAHIVLRWHH